jgi:hypothetical protein
MVGNKNNDSREIKNYAKKVETDLLDEFEMKYLD